MLAVALRTPLGNLLGDSLLYRWFKIVPYEFGLTGALTVTMTVLIAMYVSLSWVHFRKSVTKNNYPGKSA